MRSRPLPVAIVLALVTALALHGCAKPGGNVSAPGAAAPAAGPPSYATPEEALAALVGAVEKGDTAMLERVLGPGSADLVSSGDPIADQKERETFLGRYQAHHELAEGDSSDLVLLVGEDRWPLPIPLVRRDGRWLFDGAAGAQELVYRRIGANELRTIDVMRTYVDLQHDYASAKHDRSGPGVYASKLRSDPGTHDGLYWEVSGSEAQSPAGPLLAAAQAEGYAPGQGAGPSPYHGYLYRMLYAQGPAADGGARSYLVGGKLTGGFALLAYPANYGASGVMTFLVNQDGTVWQRDLGEQTAELAGAMQEFNPDDSWTPIAPPG